MSTVRLLRLPVSSCALTQDGTNTLQLVIARARAVASLSTSEPQCKQQHPFGRESRKPCRSVPPLHRNACTHLHVCRMITCWSWRVLPACGSLAAPQQLRRRGRVVSHSHSRAMVSVCLAMCGTAQELCSATAAACVREFATDAAVPAAASINAMEAVGCHVDQSQTRLLLRALGRR